MIFHTTSSRKWYCGLIALATLGFCVLAPVLRQDPEYHRFAGSGTLWNVLTNLPFVALGAWGLVRGGGMVALGILLTGFGSAYYHASPSDARLVWDRLPMTLVFMAVLARVLENWAGWGRLLWLLTAVGVASVAWWAWTGDLRWYAAVQFGPMLIVVPAAITDARVRPLWRAGAAYGAAKLAEAWDRPMHEAFGVAGHPVKHLLAALAAYWVLDWVASNWSFTSYATESPNSEPRPDGTGTGR